MNEVIEYTTQRDNPSWPYCEALPSGTTLYAIKHTDRYFKWTYTRYAAAYAVAQRVSCDYNPSNWVASLDNTVPSSRPIQGE